LAEPLNRGAADAAQVALPQSLILRRSESIKAAGQPTDQRKDRLAAEIRFCSNNSSGFDLTILSGFVPAPAGFPILRLVLSVTVIIAGVPARVMRRSFPMMPSMILSTDCLIFSIGPIVS